MALTPITLQSTPTYNGYRIITSVTLTNVVFCGHRIEDNNWCDKQANVLVQDYHSLGMMLGFKYSCERHSND